MRWLNDGLENFHHYQLSPLMMYDFDYGHYEKSHVMSLVDSYQSCTLTTPRDF